LAAGFKAGGFSRFIFGMREERFGEVFSLMTMRNFGWKFPGSSPSYPNSVESSSSSEKPSLLVFERVNFRAGGVLVGVEAGLFGLEFFEEKAGGVEVF
jgi:hypothetical protein